MERGNQRVGLDRVVSIRPEDRDEVAAFVSERWASPVIVTRARTHDVRELPGYLIREEGRLIGVLTLSVEGPECEVVTIDSAEEGRGIGSALLTRAEHCARDRACDRMWLVTTNDNLRALYFYQRRGFRIVAVHPDAVTRSRDFKPDIPLVASNGIPIHDEIELEKDI